jgi:hypothetical protein
VFAAYHFAPFCFQVGIYLPQALNDHGKLYVAMSRVRRKQDLKLLIIDDTDGFQGRHKATGQWYTRNVVVEQLWKLNEPARPPPPANQRQPPPTAHIESSVTLLFYSPAIHSNQLFYRLSQDLAPPDEVDRIGPDPQQEAEYEEFRAFENDEPDLRTIRGQLQARREKARENTLPDNIVDEVGEEDFDELYAFIGSDDDADDQDDEEYDV